ncbi:hypothetical protein [Algoriphagus sp. Y33]|uniref:hypothetical protein n=1 Tax=Algoriphagus sp. Y33 TaxID=2772483 RepID=UPI0017856E6A|nr:hypothetical protein [Algoriphagus sp. Y33]
MGTIKIWTFEEVTAMNSGNAMKATRHLEDLVYAKRVLWAKGKSLNEIQSNASDFEESELVNEKKVIQ